MLTIRTTPDAALSLTTLDVDDMSRVFDATTVAPTHNASKFAQFAEYCKAIAYNLDSFGGITSRMDAEKLLTNGWREGAQRASEVGRDLANLATPVKSTRRRIRWDEQGSELNIDRALRGEWDRAWRNTTHAAPGAPRILSLGCTFGGPGVVSHAELFWCAAQMIVTTDILEHAGYAVELRALKANENRGNYSVLDILVKRADQPLRADTVAAVFGHAGVYRTFGHGLLHFAPHHFGLDTSLPRPVGASLDRLASLGMLTRPDYVIEHAYNAKQATANIATALTTLTAGNA